MEIGQKVVRTPVSFVDPMREQGDPRHLPMSGRVVYIHPKGRFHVVEFQTAGGAIRECFMGACGMTEDLRGLI